MTTVLVVDDSASDRELVGGLLEKTAGHTVVFACDGKEALEQIDRHVPDLVVTDLQMPEMDGLELVVAAKKAYPLIPVVLMTAKGSEEIAVAALQTGASSYVSKTSLARDLPETVERVLAAAQEERTQSRLMMHRMTHLQSEFVLENDVSLIPPLVNHLQRMVRYMGICGEAARLRIGVALEEALVNALYHGNLEIGSELREDDFRKYYELASQRQLLSPYQERALKLRVSMTRSEAVFVITDEGPGFDLKSLPDPRDPINLERPCFRGVLLMRTFMDEVSYNDRGNEVTMTKRRAEDFVDVTVNEHV